MKTPQEAQEILHKAVNTFLANEQMDMLIEECAELIKAINKLRRSDSSIFESTFHLPTDKDSPKYCKAYWDVCSEIADVKIMIAQAEIIFSKPAVQLSIDRKLDRLETLIEKK